MEQAANTFKALADPTRVRILHLLRQQPLCVCHLTEALSISQAKTSRHLAVLRNAGLVSSTKQAQWVWYSLAPHPLLASESLWQYVARQPGAAADLERLNSLDPDKLCQDVPPPKPL